MGERKVAREEEEGGATAKGRWWVVRRWVRADRAQGMEGWV